MRQPHPKRFRRVFSIVGEGERADPVRAARRQQQRIARLARAFLNMRERLFIMFPHQNLMRDAARGERIMHALRFLRRRLPQLVIDSESRDASRCVAVQQKRQRHGIPAARHADGDACIAFQQPLQRFGKFFRRYCFHSESGPVFTIDSPSEYDQNPEDAATRESKMSLPFPSSAGSSPQVLTPDGLVRRPAGQGINAPVDSEGRTLLQLAVLGGDAVAVERLLKAGANINQLDSYGRNAAFHAAGAGNAELFARLLKAGADISGTDDSGRPVAFYAFARGLAPAQIDALRRAGLPLDRKDKSGRTLLHAAVTAEQPELADYLRRTRPAQLEAVDADGRTPLHAALAARAYKSFALLLAPGGADALARTRRGETALHLAAAAGDMKALELLLALPELRRTLDVFRTADTGHTPLMLAAQNGHMAVVLRLAGLGADVNLRDTLGRHSLFLAVQKGDVSMAQLLIAQGADVAKAPVMTDDTAGGRRPMLHAASEAAYRQMLRVLLDAGIDLELRDGHGQTALFRAAEGARLSTRVRALLEAGADANAADLNGRRPIDVAMNAVTQFNPNYQMLKETVEALLNAGADPNISPDARGLPQAPLHLAARLRYADLARQLVERGARVDELDRATGQTPFLAAALAGSRQVAEYLRAQGADITLRDKSGRGALHLSAASDDSELLGLLLRDPAFAGKLDLADANGSTALHHAALQRQDDNVRLLVAAGAKLDARDAQGFTPLHRAVKSMNADVVGAFEAYGAARKTDWNIRTIDTLETPLHLAARHGNYAVIERLLRNPVDFAAVDARGLTPLMAAAEASQFGALRSIAERMNRAGQSVDLARDAEGRTALHLLVERGDMSAMASQLIDFGASHAARTKAGDTPLHLALRKGNKFVARTLLSRGADAAARNNKGETPLDLAKRLGDADLVAVITARLPAPPAKPAAPAAPAASKPAHRKPTPPPSVPKL